MTMEEWEESRELAGNRCFVGVRSKSRARIRLWLFVRLS